MSNTHNDTSDTIKHSNFDIDNSNYFTLVIITHIDTTFDIGNKCKNNLYMVSYEKMQQYLKPNGVSEFHEKSQTLPHHTQMICLLPSNFYEILNFLTYQFCVSHLYPKVRVPFYHSSRTIPFSSLTTYLKWFLPLSLESLLADLPLTIIASPKQFPLFFLRDSSTSSRLTAKSKLRSVVLFRNIITPSNEGGMEQSRMVILFFTHIDSDSSQFTDKGIKLIQVFLKQGTLFHSRIEQISTEMDLVWHWFSFINIVQCL